MTITEDQTNHLIVINKDLSYDTIPMLNKTDIKYAKNAKKLDKQISGWKTHNCGLFVFAF